MECKSYTSPSTKATDTLIRPRSFIFSPINEENPDSCSTTPRRKLCLDLSINSLQSPIEFDMLTGETRSPNETISHIYSRRQRSSLVLPGKENVYDYFSKTRPLSSLPTSPLSNDTRSASIMKQIFSPLERMKLDSPIPISCTSDNSNGSSTSDGYFSEVFESTSDENSNSSIPDSINTILTQPFSLNVNNKGNTPISMVRSRSCSLRACLKRPTPLERESLPGERQPKRTPLADTGNNHISSPIRRPIKGTALFRTQSLSIPPCENALFPISPGDGGVETIGDHSRPYVLPLWSEGTVTDLKNITPETLARLMNKDYCDLVQQYTIIDCRYPYEYTGGHIKGAVNIWEKDIMLKQFFTSPTHPPIEVTQRNIIIFHCEFSSKRGPDMSRYMRKIDREKNGMNFPKLFYPEIYLLHGGYKNFYQSYPLLCDPQSYKCMIDENHKEDLKHFSKRSKSWNGGDNTTTCRRIRHRHSVHDIKGLSGGKYL